MTPAEIAELRDFISGELREVRTRLDRMDGRFDTVDGRLDGLDGRLERVDDGLSELRDEQHRFQDHVARHFTDFSTRLRRAEVTEEARQNDFRTVGEGLTDMNRKIDDLRSDMNRGFQELREETRLGFREHGKRLGSLETRVGHLEAGT